MSIREEYGEHPEDQDTRRDRVLPVPVPVPVLSHPVSWEECRGDRGHPCGKAGLEIDLPCVRFRDASPVSGEDCHPGKGDARCCNEDRPGPVPARETIHTQGEEDHQEPGQPESQHIHDPGGRGTGIPGPAHQLGQGIVEPARVSPGVPATSAKRTGAAFPAAAVRRQKIRSESMLIGIIPGHIILSRRDAPGCRKLSPAFQPAEYDLSPHPPAR